MNVVRFWGHKLSLLKNLLLSLLSAGMLSCTLETAIEDLTRSYELPIISFDNVTVTEAGTATVTFTTNKPLLNDIVINYFSTNDSAVSGSDFTALTGSVTILQGQTTASFTFTTTDDSIFESTEQFTITGVVPSTASFDSGSLTKNITVTIIDDDIQPTVQYASATSNESEAITPHLVEVTVIGTAQAEITVNYAVTGGTATGGGVDYTLAAGTLTFLSGETSKFILIPIVNDLLFEGDETIALNLTSPTVAVLGSQTTHIYTINDNDALPFTWLGTTGDGLWSTDGNWAGGSKPGPSNVAIFTSACGSQCAVSIDMSINIAGIDMQSDYTGTITQGATQTIEIGDSGFKLAAGTFVGSTSSITVKSSTGYVFDQSGGTFTAGNGDISFISSGPTRTTFRQTAGTFTHSSGTIKFIFDVSAGSAVYTLEPASTLALNNIEFLSDGSGSAFAQFTITTAGGRNIRANGTTIFGRVSGSTTLGFQSGRLDSYGASVTANAGTTKTEGFSGGTIQFLGATNQTYGGAGYLQNIIVDKTAGTLTASTSTAYVTGITLIAGSLTAPSTDLFISANQSQNVFVKSGGTFSHNNGTIKFYKSNQTANETYTINITSPTDFNNLVFEQSGGLANTATYTFSNRSQSILGSLNATKLATAQLSLVDGTLNVFGDLNFTNLAESTISVGLIGTSTQTVNIVGTYPRGNVIINKSSGSVELASNWTLSGASQDLTLSSGNLYMNGYHLTISDSAGTDNVLTLEAGTRIYKECGILSYEAVSGTGTIYDGNDVSLSLTDASDVTEGAVSSFVATLSAPNCMDTTFDYATSSGTAISGSDFVATSGTFTIASGNTTGTINVTTTDDSSHEPTEYFTVTLSNLMSGVTAGDIVATGNILDNDSAPVLNFSLSSQSVSEGVGTATISVNVSVPSGFAITLPFSLSGTATGGEVDYSNPSSPLTITAGSSTAQIVLPIIDDSTFESDETVIFTMAAPTNATLGSTTVHILTIQDDDTPFVNWTASSQTFSELNGFQGDLWASSLSAWQNRIRIHINNLSIDETLTNVPVLVKLNSSRINYSHFKAAGEDLRFVASDGSTLLPYQIERWNSSGDSIIWVRVPQISANSADDYFYMYYNNPSATDAQSSATVWSNGYRGVYHFNESPPVDSSGYQTTSGASVTVADHSQLGFSYSFNGTTQNASTTNSHVQGLSGTVVIEAWIRNLTTANGVIFDSCGTVNCSSNGGFRLALDNGKVFLQYAHSSGTESNKTGGVGTVLLDQPAYIVGVIDGTANTIKTYVNTILDREVSTSVDLAASTAASARFGRNNINSSLDFIAAQIDEVRISNTLRSTGWIRAQYLSMNDSYLSYGAVQNQLQGLVTVTAQLSAPAQTTILIPFLVSGTSSSLDHNLEDSTLTITTGNSSASIQFNVFRDNIFELDETVILTLDTPVNALLGTTTVHAVTITDFTNTDPVATNDNLVITPDTVNNVLSVLSNDADVDGDTLFIIGATSPQYGTISFTGTTIIYTPWAHFSGLDSIDYIISDGNGGLSTATVTLTVRSSYNWTGASGDGLWTTAGNWYGAAVPGATHTAYFSDSFCGTNCNVTWPNSAVTTPLALKTSHNYTGTITQAAGATITIGNNGLFMQGGTFTGSNSTINIRGPMTLALGTTFNSTSGTLSLGRNMSPIATQDYYFYGTFNHNSGTVAFISTYYESAPGNRQIVRIGVPSTVNFYNLYISIRNTHATASGTATFSLIDADTTLTVLNDLTFMSGSFESGLRNFGENKILLHRNLIANCSTVSNCAKLNITVPTGTNGHGLIEFVGNNNSTYSVLSSAGGTPALPSIQINKSTNSVTVSSADNSIIKFAGLSIKKGEFIAPDTTLILGQFFSSSILTQFKSYNQEFIAFSLDGGLFTHNSGQVTFDYLYNCTSSTCHTNVINLQATSNVSFNNVSFSLDNKNTGQSAIGHAKLINDGVEFNVLGQLTLSCGYIMSGEISLFGNLNVQCSSAEVCFRGDFASNNSTRIIMKGSDPQTYTMETGSKSLGIVIDKNSSANTVSPTAGSEFNAVYLEVNRGTLNFPASGQVRLGHTSLVATTFNYGLELKTADAIINHNDSTFTIDSTAASSNPFFMTSFVFRLNGYSFNLYNFILDIKNSTGVSPRIAFAAIPAKTDVISVLGDFTIKSGGLIVSPLSGAVGVPTQPQVQVYGNVSLLCNNLAANDCAYPFTNPFLSITRGTWIELLGGNKTISLSGSALWPFAATTVNLSTNSNTLTLNSNLSNLDPHTAAAWANTFHQVGIINENSYQWADISTLQVTTGATCTTPLSALSYVNASGSGCQ